MTRDLGAWRPIAELLVDDAMDTQDGRDIARYYFLPGQIADDAFVIRVTRVPVEDWERRHEADVEDVVQQRVRDA